MASNLLLRNRGIHQAGHPHNSASTPLPLQDRTLLGSLKKFYNFLRNKVVNATEALPHEPFVTGVTTKENNSKWAIWKGIFTVSSASLIVCLTSAPFLAFIHPFPKSYLLFWALMEVFLVLAVNQMLILEITTVRCFDVWISFLRLDSNITMRLLKLLIINVFYSLGYENFSVLVVYAASLFSMSSISVCKMSTYRFYFSINTIDDFIGVLFTASYTRLVKQRNYFDAAIYASPIILAVVAKLTDTIYPPVKKAEEEIAMTLFLEFGNPNTAAVTRATRMSDMDLDAARSEMLFEMAKKNIRESIFEGFSSYGPEEVAEEEGATVAELQAAAHADHMDIQV